MSDTTLATSLSHWTRRLRGTAATQHALQNEARYSVARHRHRTSEALFLVRLYQAVSLIVAFLMMPQLWEIALEEPTMDPRWPVFWVPLDAIRTVITAIMLLYVGSAILAAVCYQRRLFRACHWVMLVQAVALLFSFGYTNNYFHIWMWLGLFFIFIPNLPFDQILASRRHRHQSLLVFSWATAFMLLFYTLSGIGKLRGIIPDKPDMLSSLHPDALANLVVKGLVGMDWETPLGHVLAEMPILGWPAYIAVIYIETIALMALFRPALLAPLGWCLMAMHFGIWFFMNILFYLQPLQALMMLAWSPLRPRQLRAMQVIEELPGIGSLAWYARNRPDQKLLAFWWREEWPVMLLIVVLGLTVKLPEAIAKFL